MKTNKTNWRKKFFTWHTWAGLIFGIPLLLVAITAILIAHEKGLGTNKIAVKMGWMPGYAFQDEAMITDYLHDIKSVTTHNNQTLFGTRVGVVAQSNEKQYIILQGSEGLEIRDLMVDDDILWVAAKQGLFTYNFNGGLWKQKASGEFHGIDKSGKTLLASQGKYGVTKSENHGNTWVSLSAASELSKSGIAQEALKGVKKNGYYEQLTLEKLVLDIHTGKAFFGEGAMWFWIDLLGLSLLFMFGTGVWMWYKRKFRKPAKNNSAATPQPYLIMRIKSIFSQ